MSACDLLVIGGGPAGSTAAAIAAGKGLDVVLLEAGSHPRANPRVGESMLPGIIPILDEIGALEAVESAGYTRKTGSTQLNWGRTPRWDLWFADTDAYDHAWLIERSRLDHILFEAARSRGARVHERAVVTGLLWEGDRLTGVEWQPRDGPAQRTVAPMVIDASGQAALIGRSLGLRSLIPGLKHRCSWAHFRGANRLPAPRRDQAVFVADERHWMWFFPLTETLSSVGVVFQDADDDPSEEVHTRHYETVLSANAEISALLGPDAERVSRITSERDWSYRMERVCGPGWILAGDSSGFIDPILSSGVFLAMHSAAHAARTAVAIAGGQRTEADALAEYQSKHSEILDDMVRIVLFYYERSRDRDDYFWESKRILAEVAPRWKPQRSFLVLTSGLVKNLVLDERRDKLGRRRTAATQSAAASLVETHDPDELAFVCIHLRYTAQDSSDLWLLIEPADPADPTLFRSRNWHINCLAPRFGNDPIQYPELAPHLRAISDEIIARDDVGSEPLAEFWRRNRESIMARVDELPGSFELLRVFGE